VWVFSLDLDDVINDDLDEDPARISPDTRAFSPDLAGKKKKLKKKRTDRYLIFSCIFLFKKNSKFWRRV
jgi:hypothetical protein